MSIRVDFYKDLKQKVAALVWWSQEQAKIKDRFGKTPRNILESIYPFFIPEFDGICCEVASARVVRAQKINKEIEKKIDAYLPVRAVAKHVNDYLGLLHIPLRDFMKRDESIFLYSTLAKIFPLEFVGLKSGLKPENEGCAGLSKKR